MDIATSLKPDSMDDVRIRTNEYGIWLDAILGRGSTQEMTLSIPLTPEQAWQLAETLSNAAISASIPF